MSARPNGKTNPYPRKRYRGHLSYRHRDTAALLLGRPLKPEEVVHHKNGDRGDYHPDNLGVFSSTAAHARYHHYVAREASGVQHLFSLEEWLAAHGEKVVR